MLNAHHCPVSPGARAGLQLARPWAWTDTDCWPRRRDDMPNNFIALGDRGVQRLPNPCLSAHGYIIGNWLTPTVKLKSSNFLDAQNVFMYSGPVHEKPGPITRPSPAWKGAPRLAWQPLRPGSGFFSCPHWTTDGLGSSHFFIRPTSIFF